MLPLTASVGYRPADTTSAAWRPRVRIALPSPDTPRPPPRLQRRAPTMPSSAMPAPRHRADDRRSVYAVSPTNERSSDTNNVLSARSSHTPMATTVTRRGPLPNEDRPRVA